MPLKPKFTKEQIIDSAFQIAKEEGIDKITIRKVANHLGSSSAPIYVNFKDVQELKRAVIKKNRRMEQADDSGATDRKSFCRYRYCHP